MTDQAPELLPDIVERCRRYAVVIEGIIVVPDDWQPGEDHREVKEPRATLLEAADIIERLTRPTPAERPVSQEYRCPTCERTATEFRGYQPERCRDPWHKTARPVPQVREALALAIKHIEHMAAFITEANSDYHCGTYSFESLGEDMPGIRAALTARPSDAAVAWREALEPFAKAAGQAAWPTFERDNCLIDASFGLRVRDLRKAREALALPPDEPARVTPTVGGEALPDVHDYVMNYSFEFDGGGSLGPNEQECAMLEDAIEGYLALLRSPTIASEKEPVQVHSEASATGCDHPTTEKAVTAVMNAEWSDVAEDDPAVVIAAHAIAEHGIGRPWGDFLPTNAFDVDHGDLIEYGRAAVAALRAGSLIAKGEGE